MLASQTPGPVTFLFSDIEGSTRLWESQTEAMAEALRVHDRIMRDAIDGAGGAVFKTVGDGFYANFGDPNAAVLAAARAQHALQAQDWPTTIPIKVRMAIHMGVVEVRDNDFFGTTLNRVARLLSTGYGSQVLLSQLVADFTRNSLPEGCALREMGQHRLKDLASPENVFMLLHEHWPSDFPPLKSLDVLPNNIPRQLTSFVGREQELATVADLLENAPLITLTGSGGTGKSRLALQAGAEQLERYPDGVWFVELAALTEPEMVAQAVASVLSVREGAGLTFQRALLEFAKGKEMLLILDNCEHLITACARLVEDLLRASPRLRVLATSREPLGVGGEAIHRVPSMAVGANVTVQTAEDALRFEAVQLLNERAQLVQPSFRITDANASAAVRVCQQLDGIPFAIELAASRLKALTIEQVGDRLRDRFRLLTGGSRTALPRQQTLRAMIDWSHDLLDDVDKTVLRRVAVFAGGWTLEAAEEICGDEVLESWEILDALSRLVDKSLVVLSDTTDEARYRLLETVRQYATEKLGEAGEEAFLRDRHATYYSRYAIEAEKPLLGPEQPVWLHRLETEHENIRVTLVYCRTHPDRVETGLAMVGAIGRFWTVRGYLTEGREWIETLLEVAPPEASKVKAAACRTAGQMAYWQGDAQAGRRFGEMSLAMCRELGDEEGETISLFRLGFATLSEGNTVDAKQFFEEALVLARRLDDQEGIPHLLNALGEVSWAEGNLMDAGNYFRESLARFRAQGDQRSIASVMKNLAMVACDEGKSAEARQLLREGLKIRQELQNPTGIALTFECLGVVDVSVQNLERGALLLAAGHNLHRVHGSRAEAADALRISQAIATADSGLGHEAFDQIWERGLALPTVEAIRIAESDELGAVAHAYAG